MDRKKYGTKVKRTTNLYKKKRSKTSRVLSTILLIVIVVGLGFLGYFVGKPLLDFFRSDKKPAETTAVTTVESISSDITTDGSTVVEETTAPVPDISKTAVNAVEAPVNVLQSEKTLTAFLKEAVNKKYNAVIINLKDEAGNLYYKSSIEALKDTDIVKGTLSLGAIKSIFDAIEVKPIVRMSTLKDAAAPVVIKDSTYRFSDDSSSWLDDRAEKGGKLWLNPFKPSTINYIDDLTEEITLAGFENIVYTNMLFPFMRTYDMSILPKNVSDKKNRYKPLMTIEKNGMKHTTALSIEIEAIDMIAYDGYGDSAEIMRGKPSGNLNVVFRKSDFNQPVPLQDDNEIKIAKDIADQIKQVYTEVKKKAGAATITPCIDTEGLSTKWINTIATELQTLGLENIMFGNF